MRCYTAYYPEESMFIYIIYGPSFSLRLKVGYTEGVSAINRMGNPINSAIGFGLQKSGSMLNSIFKMSFGLLFTVSLP